ncbi:hypothetical protein DMC30DRAFT_124630 [Rhodotorula diobovata]|uniref:Uncharacterized protein n=1 Tax=Rhodotorula diobovata TaxID=5288 RepID=A0A5C5G2Z3_9BASI|nr:hypothetical protein DMC30DRAFT_124630 [Rhodotorula diobovata]
MAVSLDPSPLPPAAPTTLLATLRAYTRLLETRRALQAELDSALSSFLSGLGTPLPSSGDALAAPSPSSPSSDAPPPEGAPRSTCAIEAIRPPSQPELEQALQIGFGGLVELKEEARVLRGLLGDKWGREDLQGVVGRIEGWESERMRATLERDQMRRLETLQPELDFASSVAEKNALRDSLAAQVQEEVQEIHAEIAELTAAETEGQEAAPQ